MIYSIDFDGVLCEDKWPEIGAAFPMAILLCKALKQAGHKLILNTCREGKYLDDARKWCENLGLVFDAYNENLPERIAQYGGDCRKISADYYIDDKNATIEDGRILQ